MVKTLPIPCPGGELERGRPDLVKGSGTGLTNGRPPRGTEESASRKGSLEPHSRVGALESCHLRTHSVYVPVLRSVSGLAAADACSLRRERQWSVV
jgi:hypothetical protein